LANRSRAPARRSAGAVAGGENGVELLQQTRPQLLFFFLGLLAKLVGLGRGLASFIGFDSQGLLLGESFGLSLLGFLFLAGGFLRGFQSLGFCDFGLGASGVGFRAGSGLCVSVGPGLRGTIIGSFLFSGRLSLRFFFRLLLDRHHSRLFGGLRRFAGSGFDGTLVLLAAIGRFRAA
jgi:hypothetical protein